MKNNTLSWIRSPFGIWILSLCLFIIVGVTAILIVFTKGLIVTNLTNLVPWGLWITIDLSSIALAGGAFLFCAAVYLLKLEQYEPMARTATYIGLIGYAMAMMCLLIDIGRPERFWHGFVFWNVHSVLWEVTMCVGLYFSVLVVENIPTVARWEWLRNRFPALTKKMDYMHHYAPYLAIAGLFLSLLHQSSLGATYGVLVARPIWFRPGIAFLFILSAGIAGIAITSLATEITGILDKKSKVNISLIESSAKFLAWAMILNLYLRFWDIFAMSYTPLPGRDEGLSILISGSLAMNFWMGEILFGLFLPIIILLNEKTRKVPVYRMLAFAFAVAGVIAYRWDTNLLGQLIVTPPLPFDVATTYYTSYTPSLVEWTAAIGIISIGLFLFSIGVKFFRVVDHSPPAAHQ